MDIGSFASGVVGGIGGSVALAFFAKAFLEEGIADFFKGRQFARGTIGAAEIEYRQRQLAEFYSPLYAYLQGNKPVFDLWIAHRLHHINEPLKAHFREANEAMLAIIRSKSHFVDEEIFPPEMARFMTAVTIWNLFTSQQDGLPPEVAALPDTEFPQQFPDYIFAKTKALKKDLEQLYKKYRIK